jgi:hypothetical protein
MTENDATLIDELHANLAAVADEIGADGVDDSDEMKALGAALSGRPEAAEKTLQEKDEEASKAELAVETLELSRQIADALDVPKKKRASNDGQAAGLGSVADKLGGW